VPDSYGSMGDEETRSLMEKVKKMRVKEERRNLAKAILITESIRKKGVGEAEAEEIIRKFGDGCIYTTDKKLTRGPETRASKICKEH